MHRYFYDIDDKADPTQIVFDDSFQVLISSLILLGILHCKGSKYVKASAFYDLVKDGLNDYIDNSDPTLNNYYKKLV